jgi:tyrosyl-tRNA synthetase
MGKTAAGAVWLNADMLSPYDYWQYWRNTEDADVGRFLRLFTDLPESEIARLAVLQGAELNEAKKILATETTAMAHSREAAVAAAETARRTFEEGAMAEGLPTFEFVGGLEKLQASVPVTFTVAASGMTSSASEARRFIEGGGLRVNDVVVKDVKATLSVKDLKQGVIKLSIGKKKHILVKPV